MLLFCPNCNNILAVTQTESTDEYPLGQNAFSCRTCPYQFVIDDCYFENKVVKAKKAEDIINEADLWKGANETEVLCARECGGTIAYYFQRQIRSADEPMTTNYKCKECGHEWREN